MSPFKPFGFPLLQPALVIRLQQELMGFFPDLT
jgi:hypothetical protein